MYFGVLFGFSGIIVRSGNFALRSCQLLWSGGVLWVVGLGCLIDDCVCWFRWFWLCSLLGRICYWCVCCGFGQLFVMAGVLWFYFGCFVDLR